MTAAVTFRRQCQTENEWDTFKGRMKKERGKSSLSLSLSLRSVLSKSQRSDSFCSLTCRQPVKVDEGGDMASFRCIGGEQQNPYIVLSLERK